MKIEPDHGAPRIDTCDGAFRFVNKPYFPIYLGHGPDALLINLHGSGDARWGGWDFSVPYSILHAKGWFRSYWRTRQNTRLPYGRMMPLVELSARPIVNGDLAIPRDLQQYFDPLHATVVTRLHMEDHETQEWLRLRVRTYLRRHVLVEQYEVLEAPRAGAQLAFRLDEPGDRYLELAACHPHEPYTLEVEDRLALLRFTDPPGHAAAGSWIGGDATIARTIIDDPRDGVGAVQYTTVLHTGATFVRCVTVVDSRQCADPAVAIRRLVRRTGALSVESWRRRHEVRWQRYHDTSDVRIDPTLDQIYRVSRYVLKSIQHPGGFLPMGNLPFQWQGAMFWDAWFATMALLGAGNRSEARRIIRHVLSRMPEARRFAAQHGHAGARVEWTMALDALDHYDAPVRQYHNNAVWAIALLETATWLDDERLLEEAIPAAAELLRFLGEVCFETDAAGVLRFGRLEGIDESVSNEKRDDTWTVAAFLAGLQNLRRACERLGRCIPLTECNTWITVLEGVLRHNVDSAGCLQSFAGGKRPHWGSLIFDLYPDHPAWQPTLAKMQEYRDPALDTVNFHSVNRYPERSFPWATLWAARILGRHGDAGALSLIHEAVRWCNMHGGLPERVFYHGERYVNWMMTAHAAFVWALHGALAVADQHDNLRICGGLAPDSAQPVSFRRLEAGQGLIVTAQRAAGGLAHLEIENLRAPRTITLLFHNQTTGRAVRLQKGANILPPA